MSDWNKDVLLAENGMIIKKQTATINELSQENSQLKQQLAEKEEEIEQLKESQSITFQTLKETDAELEKYQKQSVKLRHEICEKIRNLIPECSGMKMIIMLDEKHSLNELLDKLEKGE